MNLHPQFQLLVLSALLNISLHQFPIVHGVDVVDVNLNNCHCLPIPGLGPAPTSRLASSATPKPLTRPIRLEANLVAIRTHKIDAVMGWGCGYVRANMRPTPSHLGTDNRAMRVVDSPRLRGDLFFLFYSRPPPKDSAERVTIQNSVHDR